MSVHSPAMIVRQLLLSLGLGATSSTWTVFVAALPESPDEAICVYDVAGRPVGRLMVDGTRIIHPGITVRVRGREYPATWNKANDIALAFDSVWRTVVAMSATESYLVLNISRAGSILPLGVEEEGGRRRHDLTVNAMLTLEQ